MKIPKSQNNKSKTIFITTAVVVVLLASYTGAAFKLGLWPFTSTDQPTLTEEQKEAENSKPTNTSKENTTENSDTGDNGSKTADEVPVDTSTSVTITQLTQDDKNVNLTAAIKNSSSTGTCVVNFTNANDRPITRQLDSTTKDGVNICGPVTVSNLEFSYLGEWNVQVTFYNDGKQVTISDKINIR